MSFTPFFKEYIFDAIYVNFDSKSFFPSFLSEGNFIIRHCTPKILTSSNIGSLRACVSVRKFVICSVDPDIEQLTSKILVATKIGA